MSNENASDLPAATAALSAENRRGLINALKDKLQDWSGKDTDVLETLESLEPNVRKRVEVLLEIQKQHDELESKFLEEKAALEVKYEKLYEPLYTKRYEIVSGVVEVADVTNDATGEHGDKPTQEKGVPDFWLNAMKANDMLRAEISKDDEEALKYLKDIKYSRVDDPKGFKLDFIFDPNPFFKNSVLTKTYHLIDEDDEPVVAKAIGTEIEWFAEKNLTQKPSAKKTKKGSKSGKSITKPLYCASFFNFFSPPQVPEDFDGEDLDDDFDGEDVVRLQNQLEDDYELGFVIQEELIPNAVSWFTGEAVEDDVSIGLSDIDEEDDEDEDNEEGDDEEKSKDK